MAAEKPHPADIALPEGAGIGPGTKARAILRPNSFVAALCWILAYKAVFALVVFACIAFLPPTYSVQNFYSVYHYQPAPDDSITRYFNTWDTQLYLSISQLGYAPGRARDAFYPLWPVCIRLFTHIVGNPTIAGLILSNVFSTIGLALLYLYLRELSKRMAARATVLLLAFPAALFLFFPYSESLFLLLSVWLLRELRHNRYRWASAAAFLAALSRPPGVLLLFVILWHAYQTRQRRAALAAAGSVAGYGCYLLIMYQQTGDAFAALAVQHDFQADASLWNLINIPAFVRAFFDMRLIHDYTHSPFDRLVFCWFAATLPIIWRRYRELFAYAIVTGLLPALLNHFLSYSRFAIIAFPMFLATADALDGRRLRPLFWLLVLALIGLQFIAINRHMNFYWVG